MCWFYKGQEFTIDDVKDYKGFVYIITCLYTGKRYIGQKVFYFSRTLPPLKSSGSKRKRKIQYQSDWVTYWGSNTKLQEIVAANKDPLRFKREILYLCNTASEMNYLEYKLIFANDAILSSEFFNEYIHCRINANSLKNMQIN